MFVDKNDNKVSYKGIKSFGEIGDEHKILATVKDHEVFNDTKQTVINRPKVLEDK